MDEDDTPLTQIERLALADRDSGGRFVKGHKKSSPGRPVGAVNKITRSLREQVLDGFENDVPGCVKSLKQDYPPAAAGLLARLMPPADTADDDPGGGGTVIVNILPIRSGTFVGPVDSPLERIVSPAERRPELRVVVTNTGPMEVELIDETPIVDEPPNSAA